MPDARRDRRRRLPPPITAGPASTVSGPVPKETDPSRGPPALSLWRPRLLFRRYRALDSVLRDDLKDTVRPPAHWLRRNDSVKFSKEALGLRRGSVVVVAALEKFPKQLSQRRHAVLGLPWFMHHEFSSMSLENPLLPDVAGALGGRRRGSRPPRRGTRGAPRAAPLGGVVVGSAAAALFLGLLLGRPRRRSRRLRRTLPEGPSLRASRGPFPPPSFPSGPVSGGHGRRRRRPRVRSRSTRRRFCVPATTTLTEVLLDRHDGPLEPREGVSRWRLLFGRARDGRVLLAPRRSLALLPRDRLGRGHGRHRVSGGRWQLRRCSSRRGGREDGPGRGAPLAGLDDWGSRDVISWDVVVVVA